MHTRRITLLLAASAAALSLASCTKTDTVGTGPTTVAPASSGTTPGSAAPTTTATKGTEAPKKKTTTSSGSNSSMEPNTHATKFSDGSAVTGEMTCSYGNKHLRLLLEGFEDSSRVVLDLDPKEGAETDEAELVVRAKNNGRELASGTANVTASVYDTTFEGKDAQGLVFSFSARFTAKEGTPEDTFTGQGSCILDGDRIGGDKPVEGGSLSMPVTDAAAFAEQLVKLAVAGADDAEDAFGAPDIWVAEGLPKTALTGYGNEASATKISGFASVSDKNGAYVAYPFAVSDGTTCAYGLIYTNETQTKPAGKVLETSGECSGSAALEAFEATVLKQ